MDIQVIEATPQPEGYCQMRVAAALSPKSLEAAQVGMQNLLFAVSV